MKTFLTILIVIAVIIGGYFALNKTPGSETNQPIKIGALLILSGDFGKHGEIARNGIQMAIDAYNNNPQNERKVEIIYEDTKANPAATVSAYRKLTTLDNVDVILGPLLQTEMAAIDPLVEQDGIPVFSVAPVPMERRGSTANPLVIWPDPTLESEQMAEYIYDQGVRSVAILNTRDTWEAEVSDAFSKKFIELGGKIVAHETVLPDSDDTSLPVTKVIAAKPEAVFVGTYYKFVYFVKKLGELGFKGKLYSIEIDTSLADLTKPYSDGLQFISPAFYTSEFSESFQRLYGELPSIPVGQAHDAANILLSIIPRSENSEDAIKKMSELREFDGVSGTIEFTDDHRAVFPLNIFEIQNGMLNKIK